jgi:hypothetical protein
MITHHLCCVFLCLQEIIEFLFFPVVNEGCRVVAEGIVDKAADLDVATVMAMGFPPYRSVAMPPAVVLCGQYSTGCVRVSPPPSGL